MWEGPVGLEDKAHADLDICTVTKKKAYILLEPLYNKNGERFGATMRCVSEYDSDFIDYTPFENNADLKKSICVCRVKGDENKCQIHNEDIRSDWYKLVLVVKKK